MLGLDQQLHWGSFAFCFALPSQGSMAQTWERVRGAGAQGCRAPLDQHPAAELSLAPLPPAAPPSITAFHHLPAQQIMPEPLFTCLKIFLCFVCGWSQHEGNYGQSGCATHPQSS